jgi:hypothetical protein
LFNLVVAGRFEGLSIITTFAGCQTSHDRYSLGAVGYKIEIKLALQALLNDLHMQQTEKAAAEAVASALLVSCS